MITTLKGVELSLIREVLGMPKQLTEETFAVLDNYELGLISEEECIKSINTIADNYSEKMDNPKYNIMNDLLEE